MLPLQCGCGWNVRTFQAPDHHQTATAAVEAQAQFNYYFIINILHIRNASAAAAQVQASEQHSLAMGSAHAIRSSIRGRAKKMKHKRVACGTKEEKMKAEKI